MHKLITFFLALTVVSAEKYLGCFRDSEEQRLFKDKTDFPGTLTNKICWDFCSNKGYRYSATQFKKECFCSNDRPSLKFISREEDCNHKCDGDPNDSCGGDWRLTVYDLREKDPTGVKLDYKGCYRESEDRHLATEKKEFSWNTPEYCSGYCYLLGYKYTGVGYGKECFCGNAVKEDWKVADDECSTPCAGDPNIKCGGGWRLSIYKNDIRDVPNASLLGCYKDPSLNARLLPELWLNFNGTLTNSKCITTCASEGYNYAGTQWSIECFCSNRRPTYLARAADEDCNSPCHGNKKEMCGGGYRLSVYDLIGDDDNYVRERNVGCFRSSRIRFQSVPGKDNVTPERCVGECFRRGYFFAGLQNGRDCSCGMLIGTEGQVPAEKCSTPCTGQKNIMCGGPASVDVYHTGLLNNEVQDDQFLGCFKDTLELRTLSGSNTELPETNSPKTCINYCLATGGYKFAGVQYGKECFCGNKVPNKNLEVGEDECQGVCPGDPHQFCGGGWRIAVYRTGGNGTRVSAPVVSQSPSPGVTTRPSCTKSKTEVKGRPNICIGDVIFSEDFTSSRLPDSFQHEILMAAEPDYEFTTFDSNWENCFIRDGKLHFKPTLLPDDLVRKGRLDLKKCTGLQTSECERQAVSYSIIPPVKSCRMNTKDSFSFKYGKIEIRARLPRGDWLYPELLLKPERTSYYGRGYMSGVVRLAGARGNKDLELDREKIGNTRLEAGFMLGSEWKVSGVSVTKNSGKFWGSDFHNYTFTWTPDGAFFSVDNENPQALLGSGQNLAEVAGFTDDDLQIWAGGSSMAPFDRMMYLSLGLHAGGMRDFPDGATTASYLKPWENFEVKAMASFWESRQQWEPTWSDDSALQIDSIKITAI